MFGFHIFHASCYNWILLSNIMQQQQYVFNPCMMLREFKTMLGRPLVDLGWLFHSFWQGMESSGECEKDDLQPPALPCAAVGDAENHLQQHQA